MNGDSNNMVNMNANTYEMDTILANKNMIDVGRMSISSRLVPIRMVNVHACTRYTANVIRDNGRIADHDNS